MRFRTVMLGVWLFPLLGIASQDTLHLSMRQADSLLVSRSLALVAEHFRIDQAEAERVQARLFHNPEFSSEWVVRPWNGPLFDVGPNGQKVLAVEQLFRIAGQRSLAVRSAEQQKRVSEAEYAELVAALRLRLHSGAYQQHYARRSVKAISSQLALLKALQESYGEQYDKGNVSLKEATRLRTAFFALNEQRIDLLRQLNALQQELRQLLVEQRVVIITPSPAELELPPAPSLPTDSLI
ncbi:MAG: TolC family protein, partial [Flavobacteriales bacterium]